MKPTEFHETISRLLDLRLKPLVTDARDLNLVACVEIYNAIFDTMVECLTGASIAISNEAMNWLSQSYYDGVLVNGHQELDPGIFTQRARLDGIETKELALLAVMLRGTDFAYPILAELKHRA